MVDLGIIWKEIHRYSYNFANPSEIMPIEKGMLAYMGRIIILLGRMRGGIYRTEEKIDFDYPLEMGDLQHLNNAGAEKATRYLCGILEDFWMSGKRYRNRMRSNGAVGDSL